MTITSYQAKKWAKGVSQIVVGIILLITLLMLLERLSAAPQEIRDSSIMGFFTMGIIFVIVWCFVSAAVSIIAGFIGKERIATLADIAKRVDGLEAKLRTANMLPAAGAESLSVMPDEKKAKSSKRIKIAVAAVIVIIIVAAIAGGLVLFAFNASPAPGAATAEQAFNTFVDRMNSKDAAGVVGQTIWTLSDNKSDYIGDVSDKMSQGFIHVDITDGPDKILKNQLNASARASTDARIDYLEGFYNIDIFDYVVLEFELSISISGEANPMTVKGMMPCVLIEDKWYLDADQLFNSGNNGGGISVMTTKSGPSGGNWTVTVDSVSGTSNLATSEVYVDVTNSTGAPILSHKQLSTFMPGVYSNGVSFNDGQPTGQLASSDSFLIDSATYEAGSHFKLTGQSSGDVYLDLAL